VKKIVLALITASAVFFMPLQARMYPTTMRLPAVCWNTLTEALSFHAATYQELPILNLQPLDNQDSHAMLLVNAKTPSWTFLYFRQNDDKTKTVCSLASGKEWDILKKPNTGKTET
tara:strand:- start:280 stop:627 length:348 start_codon:yes stop_codon:yes gene_type:complete